MLAAATTLLGWLLMWLALLVLVELLLLVVLELVLVLDVLPLLLRARRPT